MSTPPHPTQQMPVEVQEEVLTIHILREPGQGLGISIAGGKGSTPVKGDDEVSFQGNSVQYHVLNQIKFYFN